MDELFALANASLVLRLIHYLNHTSPVSLQFLTVIYEDSSWLVRLKSADRPSQSQERDLEAFLWEIGDPCNPQAILREALLDLELGQSPVAVMRQHQIVVISHGAPSALEVEIFRRDFIARLGYTPLTLV
ncbi:MAG: hypothetical protein AAGB01_07000 [Cyanobacteria bacterium P01_F01_bin.42]